jgi:hypothetical protein
MHPEVTGKQGEECSKCGMELTEPVANKEVEKTVEIIKKQVIVLNRLNFR